MKKRNRRILSVTVAILMLLVTVLPSSAAGITLIPIVQTPAALTRILSAHPELGIVSSQPLYSPTNEITAYYYTLSPTGYAIASVQGEVVEWSPTATREIPANQIVYYAGPLSYFTKSGAFYVDVYSGAVYSTAVVAAQYADFESTAQAYTIPTDVAPAGVVVPPGAPVPAIMSDYTSYVPTSYSHNYESCGCNYTKICGTIAACMLIKYYNDYVCPGIVPNWCPSPADEWVFIHYLIEYTQPGYDNSRGAYEYELASGINDFFDHHNTDPVYDGYGASTTSYTYSLYKGMIADDAPCIIATRDHTSDQNDYYDHYVVGYGWKAYYLDNVAVDEYCIVADGWGNTDVWIESHYMTYYDMVYIYD